jgi:uncharacterized protein YceK
VAKLFSGQEKIFCEHSETNMNAKAILNCILIGLLMPIMSGCFTAATTSKISQPQTESFYPRTLYKSKTDGGIAVEGTWTNHREESYHAFLMIPEKILADAHRNTGGDVTFADISALSPEVRKELQLKKKLPSGYEKIYDFPKNQTDVDLNETTKVHIGAIGALPFTLVIDAATLPVQVPLLLYVGHEFKDVH